MIAVENMTQAEYARHRGVSRQAIGKLVDGGKIPMVTDPQTGKKLIDPAAADFALGKNIERVVVRDDDPDEERPLGAGAYPASDSSGLTKAKTATEVYRARLAQLEYDSKVGKVLAIEDVTRSMERCAAAIVRELDQLPDYADDLAAAMSRDGAQGMRLKLKEISRTVRAALERTMRLLPLEDNARGEAQS